MANKGKRMLFEEDYEYLQEVIDTYPDPTDIGGSSYTAGTGIDITNDTISVDNTVAMKTDIPDTTHMVTDNTAQYITGVKTFVGDKKIKFKQSTSTDRLGFTGYDADNNELGYLETRAVDNYFNNKTSNVLGIWDASTTYSIDKYVGFKYYKTKGSDNNMHVISVAVPPLYDNTSYSSGSSIRYIPIDFKNGNTSVRSDSAGVVDLSSLIPTATSDLNNDSGFITDTSGTYET